ncbi:MAG: hypothetical protein L0Z62_05935 [Gemmataceae bacterium]|nr:hypothetical protein [Gemmataceae bacterium]
MPVEQVPDTDLSYYLTAFDADGRERTDDPDGLMSQRVLERLGQAPAVTDVFLLSHGWKGDIPAARAQYNLWIGAMAQVVGDVERMRQSRPGFCPLLIGFHWPSLPLGDESLGGGVSFAPGVGVLEEIIDQTAKRTADTPAAREALRTLFTAAAREAAPPTLPQEVREAYAVLNREMGLGGAGVAAPPGADREPFDPERYYQVVRREGVSFGGFRLGGLLAPLQQLSFWQMKDRGRHVGETGGARLLSALQQAAGGHVRFHLMGHSFGCIVVSAMLSGPGGSGPARPVHSAALVQGALSHWSYCADIPFAPGTPGYFHPVVARRQVLGPLITTQSQFDTAVGRWYPLGAGAARQVSFAPGELPKYGGVGIFGIRGLDSGVEDLAMGPVSTSYGFQPGRIYNLESSQIIREGGGASGAHSDIAHQEVAHAVWEAALAS